MSNEKIITLDNSRLHRMEDGTITITFNKGLGWINAGFLVTTAVLAFGGLLMLMYGIVQLFKPDLGSALNLIGYGLVAILMFGGFTSYFFSKMRSGQRNEPLTISPILNGIEVGGRVIPFQEVVDILVEENPAIISGLVVANFRFVLSNGSSLELGQVAVESKKWDRRKSEIIEFLRSGIKWN